ncbi:MAG: DUF1524 domain-containing protein, partial [Anaerolineae bacterium]|nr:DUF1524 domain-containing protein [Anaerolineae bacterium]
SDPTNISAETLKARLRKELTDKFNATARKKNLSGDTKTIWRSEAKQYLTYDNNVLLCRFVLFIIAQYTTKGSEKPNIPERARKKSLNYLSPMMWFDPKLEEVEHIAPQNRAGAWNDMIYADIYNSLYQHQIGNLTLLSKEINISIGNNDWDTKWMYYNYLNMGNEKEFLELIEKESNKKLTEKIIAILKEYETTHYLETIIEVGETGTWDKALIEERTNAILDVVWDVLFNEWLA